MSVETAFNIGERTILIYLKEGTLTFKKYKSYLKEWKGRNSLWGNFSNVPVKRQT